MASANVAREVILMSERTLQGVSLDETELLAVLTHSASNWFGRIKSA